MSKMMILILSKIYKGLIIVTILYFLLIINISLAQCPDPGATYRPLVGGARIELQSSSGIINVCTLGLTGYELSQDLRIASYGITTAGHCGSVGQYIYQPRVSSSNHIATVYRVDVSNIDGLYARNTGNVNITNKVLKCSSTGYARVAGSLTFTETEIRLGRGEMIRVSKYGATTNETSGYIYGVYRNLSVGSVTYYYQLFVRDMRAAPGDSGAPVYENPYAGQCVAFEPDVRAAGVIWVATSDGVYATSIDGLYYYLSFVPLTEGGGSDKVFFTR
jgi:hypothetical protein